MRDRLSRESWGKSVCVGARKDTGAVYVRPHNSMALVEIADEDLDWAIAELQRRAAERKASKVVPVRFRSRSAMRAAH